MELVRRTAFVVAWIVAFSLTALLVSLTWGLASEYGSGAGGLAVLGLVPLLGGFVLMALSDFRRAGVVLFGIMVLVLAVGLPVGATLGKRDREARLAAGDAGFTCNGPHAEARIPAEVDRAFHTPRHPGTYWLYGPISSSRYGCTAAITGDTDASYAAWRSALLDTGWDVVRDDEEVRIERDGVRLTLYVDQGTPRLNATSTSADDCSDGRSTTYDDGRVSAC